MFNIYKKMILISLFPTLAMASWLKVEGTLNVDSFGSKNGDWKDTLRTASSSLAFEAAVREGIRVVLVAEWGRIFRENGRKASDEFDFEAFIKEAYISIELDKLGRPRAIIRSVTVGKHGMAFGQGVSEVPMTDDNLMDGISKQEGVIGITFEINPQLLRIVDQVAISVFETAEDDLQISDNYGVSVKLGKKVTQQIELQVSGLYKQVLNESGPGTLDELRSSVGLVWTSEDEKTKVYGEFIYLNNNQEYLETDFAIQVGLSRQLGPGTVVFEYAYVQKYAQEMVAGYNLPVGKYLVISPEVRYQFARKYADREHDDDLRIGVRTTLHFAAEAPRRVLKP
ncbi:MAG: hypothetical protein ACOYOK_05790 [Pseudobdellovibrionaceae bacterium]